MTAMSAWRFRWMTEDDRDVGLALPLDEVEEDEVRFPLRDAVEQRNDLVLEVVAAEVALSFFSRDIVFLFVLVQPRVVGREPIG